MVTIERLTSFSDNDLVSINSLLRQLRTNPESHIPITVERLKTVLNSSSNIVLVVRDEAQIVGTGTLVSQDILTGKDGTIEDVVVDSSRRGQGLGKKLMLALIDAARSQNVATIYLTSRPSRVAANALYQSMGFTRKETNNYEMDL